MEVINEIKKSLEDYNGEWKEKGDVWKFQALIAERKVFLSKKKLIYSAKFKIDEENKVINFSEILTEKGSGISSGGDMDGVSTGFGFKKETYNTIHKGREGSIEEKSNLFGKDYKYKFDYKEVRLKVENVVKSTGYRFEYQVLPVK